MLHNHFSSSVKNKKLASSKLETSNLYPRYHSNYGLLAVPSGSDKPYPLTQAYGRSLLGVSYLSVLRLGRDGSLDSVNTGFHPMPALWGSHCLTVFVSAFSILQIL
jgi:hypothetical protein